MEIECSFCKHINVIGTVFCKNCGEKISDNALRKAVKKRDKADFRSKVSEIISRLAFYAVVLGIPTAMFAPVGHPEIKVVEKGERVNTIHNYKLMMNSIKGGANKKIAITPEKLNYVISSLISKQKENITEELALNSLGIKVDDSDKVVVQAKVKLFDLIPAYVELSGAPTISESGAKMEYSSAKLGHFPLPGFCGKYLAYEIHNSLAPFTEITAMLSWLKDVTVAKGKVKVDLKKRMKTDFTHVLLPGEKRGISAFKKTEIQPH